MKQAIVTKYLAPTNTKGARVKATASLARPSVTIPWDSAWSVERNHEFAAQVLRERLGWSGTLQAGSISAQSVAHVFID
jgi:hypothetical protein